MLQRVGLALLGGSLHPELVDPPGGNALLALIFPQIFFQFKFFLPDPIKNDVKYQASAQPFLVFGLLTTGLAWGHHINAIGA